MSRKIHLGECYWCEKRARLNRDHVIPLGVGGPDLRSNIVMACDPCNQERGILVSFHREIIKIKNASATQSTVNRMVRRAEYIKGVLAKWVEIENAKCGFSPSSELKLDFTADMVKIGRPPTYRNVLKEARIEAEAHMMRLAKSGELQWQCN